MQLFSKNEVIEFAIKIEENGYEFYKTASKSQGLDKKSKSLFIKLMSEEAIHKETFKKIRNNSDLFLVKKDSDWQEISEYVEQRVKSSIFDKPESSISQAINSNDAKEIINLAISFEIDTIEFFRAVREFITDKKSLITLDDIILEEQSHVALLKELT